MVVVVNHGGGGYSDDSCQSKIGRHDRCVGFGKFSSGSKTANCTSLFFCFCHFASLGAFLSSFIVPALVTNRAFLEWDVQFGTCNSSTPSSV